MAFRKTITLTNETKKICYEQETAIGTAGMVASAHPIATDIGKQVLLNGGNAVDAAIAIQFALNIVEPMMTGIGGSGFFMVYNSKTKETEIFNGHTKAPAAAHPNMFLDDKGEVIPFRKRSTRGTAVGIPGILKAMDEALKKHGTMPLSELIQPSVELAESGVKVNWVLMDAFKQFEYRLGDEARSLYFPEGRSLKEGDQIIKKHLAKTYRILQRDGISSFYEGEIAEAIIQAIKEHGGFMELEDLKNFNITVDEPVWGNYRGYDIASCNAPSAGGVTVIQILKILEHFNIGQYDIKSWEKYYVLAEAMRLAFSDKIAFLGDPLHMDIPLNGLLCDEYIKERISYIDFERRNNSIDFGNPWKYENGSPQRVVKQPDDLERSETTHFTVTDRWGNIVACTSTVEHPFGSGIMVPGYGFLLNNELTDFDALPGGGNEPDAHKRPVSCKSPTILFKEGKPFLTLGSPGGPTIVGSVFQTIINVVEFGMDIKDAIEEPRIFTSTGPLIAWEKGINMLAKGRLESMGFAFNETPNSIGNVQAILFDHEKNCQFGAADSSREGKAAGLFEEDYITK